MKCKFITILFDIESIWFRDNEIKKKTIEGDPDLISHS
jgi:hypothetical protein